MRQNLSDTCIEDISAFETISLEETDKAAKSNLELRKDRIVGFKMIGER